MPAPAHEGGRGVDEKPKDSGKREDPGKRPPAEEGILAPGHDGDLGHGGAPGDEKRKEGRPSNDPEEGKSEEKGVSSKGPEASAHGNNPDLAKQDDRGAPGRW
ncbi:unnamed protein product [Ectocarpus sp. CCAP 1310/34]|nr:unnamed protein product [Ectocarpus sp. CCAP 1310/34]